jgi:hypothetical protein
MLPLMIDGLGLNVPRPTKCWASTSVQDLQWAWSRLWTGPRPIGPCEADQ